MRKLLKNECLTSQIFCLITEFDPMSKYEEHPFTFNLHGEEAFGAKYVAGESDLAIMGGNSNWRGPVWFPLNYLLVDSH
jgi:hypothetical protein